MVDRSRDAQRGGVGRASVLHPGRRGLVSVFWGGRLNGAGRRAWSGAPTIITSLIAAMLALWSAYAFSGAGVIPPLPLRPIGLIVITAIYLARAAALPLMLQTMPDRSRRFLVTSSVIVLVIGSIHAVGLIEGLK